MLFDTKKLEGFPQKPGVYLMKDAREKVLYVGKAKNLKARVRQYFSNHDDRPQVPYLLEQVTWIDTIIVQTEKEALLLENTLIKRYKPKYNVLLKDDKSYVSIKITKNHPWPMISLARFKGKPPLGADYFGPFTNAKLAKQMFDLVCRLFPLRQCTDEEFARRERPCLLYQIKKCPAPCVGLCQPEEYKQNIENTKKLILGKNQELIRALKEEMQQASEALLFEKAHEILKKIRLLEEIKESQHVESLSFSSIDVFATYRKACTIMVTKLVMIGTKIVDARHFLFEDVLEDDKELMESFLLQHYLKEEEVLPKEIITPFELSDSQEISEIIQEARGRKVEITVPQRGEKKQFVELAKTNAEHAFCSQTSARELIEGELLELQEKLSLRHFPRRIECYDNSHLAGTGLVAAMVVFQNGEKYKAGYRKYHIKSVDLGDDYAMFREVLTRRFQQSAGKKQEPMPDLIIIDGGKGHYNAAKKVLSELGVVVADVIAVAKESGRHDKGMTREVVFSANSQEPLFLDAHSKVLHLLQKIRDEAHRFAISFQRKTHQKTTIKSALDEIKGIGPVKKKKLLQAFGSVKALEKASIDELSAVPGISKEDALSILSFFRGT